MRALLLCLAACSYSPRTTPVGESGDGSTIDATEEFLDGSPDVDSDEDGINDAIDNCRIVSNSDQRNHDGDPRGDLCDPCPHLADPVDPDGDGDGVGDACDPRPSAPGDSRVEWAGFYDTNDIPNWFGNSSFNVADGFLSSINDTSVTFGPMTLRTNVFVMTSARINALRSGFHVVGLISEYQSGTHFSACGISDQGGVSVFSSIPGTAGVTPWTGTFASGTIVQFAQMVTAPSVTCAAKELTAPTVAVVGVGPRTGLTHVLAQNVDVSFDYYFVVQMP